MMHGTEVVPGPSDGPSPFPTTDDDVSELARPVLVQYLDAVRSGQASTATSGRPRERLWTEHLGGGQLDPSDRRGGDGLVAVEALPG